MKIRFQTVRDLRNELNQLDGPVLDGYVHGPNGEELETLRVATETLSDGSKAFNIELAEEQ